MKNLLLISLVTLFTSLAIDRSSAAGLSDLAGVSWHASPAEVRQTMSGRSKFVAEQANHLQFRGGKFGGSKINSWDFEFKKANLARVTINFVVRQGSNAKGYEANQDFAEIRGALEKQDGKARLSHGDNYEAARWSLSRPPQTISLRHEWTRNVKGSSRMRLTFTS